MYASIRRFLVFSLALASQCTAQTKLIPEGWVQGRAPIGSLEEGSELLCANYSRHQWRVETESPDKIAIFDSEQEKSPTVAFPPHFVRTKEMLGKAIEFKAGDGWLIGFDAGEFGGGLWWSNADGSETKPLTGENVQVIVQRRKELLVLTGLAHLSMDQGTIYSYLPANKASQLVRVGDLGSAPGAATFQEDGALLIATERRVLKLMPDNRLRELYRNEDMAFYYPHSIAVDRRGAVFVGMRFYLLRLAPLSEGVYDAAWFVRTGCTKVKIKDFDCICIGES
jgi:hypothetical protein